MFSSTVFFTFTLSIVVLVSAKPQCGANQEYKECGSACKDYCNQEPIICTDQCVAGCYCKDGFTFESIDSDKCVPIQQCKNHPKCDKNQVYLMCGSRCPDYCGKPDGMVCPQVCTVGCFCKPGFIASGDKCIPESACKV